MDAEGVFQPDLSRAQWALVAELLRNEIKNLPAEIHHTDNRDYRDDLHQRRGLLSDALAKVERVLAG